MGKLTKEDIDKLFATGEDFTVTFKKTNGDLRIMDCTTNLASVPAAAHPKGTKPPNPDAKAVWSIEDAGWRSFRYDSVISIAKLVAN